MSNLIIRKVAVLGAGVMGAQIAAHLVNARVPVVLFDLPKSGDAKNAIAQKAMQNGMRTLRADGWKKVIATQTTIEEVLRVTQTEEHLKSLIDDRTAHWVKGS